LGLAQAGQWLARKFVQIWKFIARPNGSGSPACAKPLLVVCHFGGQDSEVNLINNIYEKDTDNFNFYTFDKSRIWTDDRESDL